MSLEVKLKKLFREFNYYKGSTVEPDTIAQIIQAFKDEGWSPRSSAYHDAFMDSFKKEAGLMTGREWYDGFEEELKHTAFEMRVTQTDNIEVLKRKVILDVAKKAAGLTND